MSLALLLWSCNDERTITTSSPEALKAYNEGLARLQLFYYAEAKASFERALQADSNFAMALARLATIHRRTENEAAANATIARAIQKSSKASRHEQMVIRLLDHWFHYRYAEAGTVGDSLISLYPNDAEVYVLRGNIYETTKNFDAALDLYARGVEADTSYALATMSLGYAYSTRGDFDKAIEAMYRYIRLVPNEADPHASYADILLRVGRYDEAFNEYQRSLELKPDYWYSISRLGDVYTVWGRLNEAEQQFDKAMAKTVVSNQASASHIATEAVLALLRGKYDEAIRLCEQSLALDSANVRAAFVVVHALLRQKKFTEAGEVIERIRYEIVRRNLGESMVMLEFHLLRARLFNEQSFFEQALASCDSAMEYGSEFTRSDVYLMQGNIFQKKGDNEEALDALEGALRYNSNSPEALLTLTKVYKAMGDTKMTASIAQRLFDLWKNADPDFQFLIELKKVAGAPRAL
jgi:tetratricopeptide (TPR) repeat protein